MASVCALPCVARRLASVSWRPPSGGKRDRIELACTALAKQLGAERCQALQDSLREVAGDSVAGKSMLSIVQPGALPRARQKALLRVFRDLTATE